jgi:hypothetical protein
MRLEIPIAPANTHLVCIYSAPGIPSVVCQCAHLLAPVVTSTLVAVDRLLAPLT